MFWLDGKPDEQVAGHLRFNAKSGATLDLIGSFYGLEHIAAPSKPVRILGVAAKQLLTLENCLRINAQLDIPGIVQERYHVSVILAGANMNEEQLAGFDAVRCELSQLPQWVGRNGTNVDYCYHDDSRLLESITITYVPPGRSTVRTELGDLEVSFPYRFHPGQYETTIAQSCSLGLRFAESSDLERAFAVCSALQNLVTIGLDAPSLVTRLSLSHADFARRRSDGDMVHDPIHAYARMEGVHASTESRSVHPSKMLFTFDDIGGLDGVLQWLNTAEKYRPVIGLLLSHWYLPDVYPENRFLNTVIAAEALQRIRLGAQEAPLKQGLVKIAESTGEVSRVLVGDIEPWADEIVRVRVKHVVHRGLAGEPNMARMHWLSESIYVLVVVSLLRECGVPSDTLARMAEHDKFRWVADQLRSTA